jgi:hypothetical protein
MTPDLFQAVGRLAAGVERFLERVARLGFHGAVLEHHLELHDGDRQFVVDVVQELPIAGPVHPVFLGTSKAPSVEA